MCNFLDNYTEVGHVENADIITLTCDYSQNVNPGDTFHLKWLNGNKVIIPGVANRVNVTIQVSHIEKYK